MPGFSLHSFALLKALATNNEKAWYEAHHEEWELCLHTPFRRVLEAVSEALKDTALPLSGGEQTLFRQHRDIRFSRDKSPYKTNISGLLTPSGTKLETEGLLYLQCDVNGGFLGCGFYKLSTTALNQFRTAIIQQPQRFKQVLDALESAGLYLSDAEKLIAMPRGFSDYYDHDYAQYLKLKQFIIRVPLTCKLWLDGRIADYVAAYAESCRPLLEFGRDLELKDSQKLGQRDPIRKISKAS